MREGNRVKSGLAPKEECPSTKSVALAIAHRLIGIEFSEIDDAAKDAIGEVCNMLAGAWKGRIPEIYANCSLSIAAVIAGEDYNIHLSIPKFRLHQGYRFDGAEFEVMVVSSLFVMS